MYLRGDEALSTPISKLSQVATTVVEWVYSSAKRYGYAINIRRWHGLARPRIVGALHIVPSFVLTLEMVLYLHTSMQVDNVAE